MGRVISGWLQCCVVTEGTGGACALPAALPRSHSAPKFTRYGSALHRLSIPRSAAAAEGRDPRSTAADRPPRRAAVECLAAAGVAVDRARAISAYARRRDDRRAAATRRRPAVEPLQLRPCDHGKRRSASDTPRSAQEAQAAASSGDRVPSRRERGGRSIGRERSARASPRRAASSSDSTAASRRAVAATVV